MALSLVGLVDGLVVGRWPLSGPVDLKIGFESTRNTRDQCALLWGFASSSGRRTWLGALGP